MEERKYEKVEKLNRLLEDAEIWFYCASFAVLLGAGMQIGNKLVKKLFK